MQRLRLNQLSYVVLGAIALTVARPCLASPGRLGDLYKEFQKAQSALRVADAELTSVEERIAKESSNVARLKEAFKDMKTLRAARELKAASQRLDKIEGELHGIAKDLESIEVTLRRIGAMAVRFKEFRLARKVKWTMAVLEAIQNRVSHAEGKVDRIREAIKQLTRMLGKAPG